MGDLENIFTETINNYYETLNTENEFLNILNRGDINWNVYAKQITNFQSDILKIRSKYLDISSTVTDFSNGIVLINNLQIKKNLNLLGSLITSENIDLNETSKILQNRNYSLDNANNNPINNLYINSSNYNINETTGLSFEILNDFSINLLSKKSNSMFKLSTNLHYLTSNYIDTKINFMLYYNVEPSGGFIIDNSEILVADYLLGTDNTSFFHNILTNKQ